MIGGADEPAARWIQEWKTHDDVDFRIGRAGDDLVAEWAGLCTVRVTASGDVRRFTPCAGVDVEKARRLLSGPVQALVRHLAGEVSLHASAVALGDAALVFLGSSTCGKSTVAADLCRARAKMLADDAAFLEQRERSFWVSPSESIHWLREDAADLFGAAEAGSAKRPLSPVALATGPVPLRLMVALVFDETADRPTLRRLHGHEAFRWMRTSLYRLIVDDPQVDARDFDKVAALYAAAPLLELRRRRCLAERASSIDLLRQAVAGSMASGVSA
jgi:hypothetical protein